MCVGIAIAAAKTRWAGPSARCLPRNTLGAGGSSALRTPIYSVNVMRVDYVPVAGTTPQATRAPPPPSGAGVSE